MSRTAFATRLKEARETARLTMAQLGVAVGVSPQAVFKWESGTAMPGSDRLSRLAIALGVPVQYLLTGTGSATQPDSTKVGGRGRTVVKVTPEDAARGVMDRPLGIVETHFACGPNAFAVEIWDHSNTPDFAPGDQIVVDPDIKARPGDMVLIAIQPALDVALGKAVVRSDHSAHTIVVQPLNPDWPAHVVSDAGAKILGVMTEHARPRRS